MAKRFIDTELLRKGWFRALSNDQKILFIYLFTQCDMAGIIEVDFEQVEFYCGIKTNKEQLFIIFPEQLMMVDDGKRMFLQDFIPFQYGRKYNEKSPIHRKIVDCLKSHRVGYDTLYDRVFKRVFNTLKEEEKAKEEEEVEVKEIQGDKKDVFVLNEGEIKNKLKYNQYNDRMDAMRIYTLSDSEYDHAVDTFLFEKRELLGKDFSDIISHFKNWIRQNVASVKKAAKEIPQQPKPVTDADKW